MLCVTQYEIIILVPYSQRRITQSQKSEKLQKMAKLFFSFNWCQQGQAKFFIVYRRFHHMYSILMGGLKLAPKSA